MKEQKMQKGMYDADYQPGMDQFAGKEFGTANEYMSRKDRQMKGEAMKIKRKAYKGRYD